MSEKGFYFIDLDAYRRRTWRYRCGLVNDVDLIFRVNCVTGVCFTFRKKFSKLESWVVKKNSLFVFLLGFFEVENFTVYVWN